ncbi:hypothetical protein FA15DRAFT_403536 [Coprinopsis marcescibilis]|uniref:Uncharacterized protein n=1 Tax=Coprinopsis marcescibilis TaxID=230819 RepID=A0A5C3KX44_COPMA|nr:hypothetical protein FA15DRAFT_403536 [Coprinopsis marcescibilis]
MLFRDLITQLQCRPRIIIIIAIIITTRPEPRIKHYLENQTHTTRFHRSFTGETSHVDLKLYINPRLARPSYEKSLPPELLQDFLGRTESTFPWAATALGHLSTLPLMHSRNSPRHRVLQECSFAPGPSLPANPSEQTFDSCSYTTSSWVPSLTRKQPLLASGLASKYGLDPITIDNMDMVFSIRHLQQYSLPPPSPQPSTINPSLRERFVPLIHPRHIDPSSMNVAQSFRNSHCLPSNKIRDP